MIQSIDDFKALQVQVTADTTNNQVQKATFNMGNNTFGKYLTYSETDQGMVYLYEVTVKTMLLVMPSTMSNNFTLKENIKHSGSVMHNTEHGARSGYLLYKDNAAHIARIDTMFSGFDWRQNLIEPLPVIKPPATPVFMTRANIQHGGEVVPASLYEYSDKQLVVFCSRDLAGDSKIMKFFETYRCPESSTGYSPGYGVWKNNPRSINFLKQMFKLPDLESRYVKSTPVISAPTQMQQSINHFIVDKIIANGTNTHKLNVTEISPLAITVIFEPVVGLDGFGPYWKTDLKHPISGEPVCGFMLPKSKTDLIEWLQITFMIENFEDRYVLTEEKTARSTGIIQQPTEPASQLSSEMSNMSIKSVSDLPIATLVRLLTEKLKTTALETKDLPDGRVIILGDGNKVVDSAANLDDMETELEIHYIVDNKRLVLLR